jgi:hypothetical protein
VLSGRAAEKSGYSKDLRRLLDRTDHNIGGVVPKLEAEKPQYDCQKENYVLSSFQSPKRTLASGLLARRKDGVSAFSERPAGALQTATVFLI